MRMLAAFVAAVCVILSAAAVEIDRASTGWAIVTGNGPCRAARDCFRVMGAALADTLEEQLGVKIPVHGEDSVPKDAPPHRFYIGGDFARRAGLLDGSFRGLDYGIAEKDGDVYLYGNDRRGSNPSNPMANTLPSALAAARFMRKHMGVLFLMPGKIGREVPVRKTLAIPDGLRERGGVLSEYQAGRSLDYPYDFANNMYGRCGFFTYGGHTYPTAVPREKYFKTHPEYFALVKGKRAWGYSDQCQGYCISNGEFQELVYRELLKRFDEGADVCQLGQNDSSAVCECDACRALYGTGDDWCEKIWRFHCDLARRIQKDRPGKLVQILSYADTATPPKGFRELPENVIVEVCSYTEEAMKRWEGYRVPQGFTYYIYNWSWYPTLGFTAKRSFSGLVEQIDRFNRYGMKGIFRCGFGELFGMEGPAYYLYHRLIEEPKADMRATLREYYGGAFGPAAGAMERFYDQLEEPLSRIENITSLKASDLVEATISRTSARDPIAALAFVYTPERVAKMEALLAAAETTEGLSRKAIRRLALVRAEFDYAKNIGRIATLYHDKPLTEEKFRAIAKEIRWRNAYIDRLYPNGSKVVRYMKDWPEIVPFGCPPKEQFRDNGRLGATIKEPLNWDVDRMLKYGILPGVKSSPEERRREVAERGLRPVRGWHENMESHSEGNYLEVDEEGTGFRFGCPTGQDVRVVARAGAEYGVRPGKTYRVSWIVRWEGVDTGSAWDSVFNGLYFCCTWGVDWRRHTKFPDGRPHYGSGDWVKESVLVTVDSDRNDMVLAYRIYRGKGGMADVRFVTIEEVE